MAEQPQTHTRVDDGQILMTATPYEGRLPTVWLRPHRVTEPPLKAKLRGLPHTTRGRDVETTLVALPVESMPTSTHLIIGARGRTAQPHTLGAHVSCGRKTIGWCYVAIASNRPSDDRDNQSMRLRCAVRFVDATGMRTPRATEFGANCYHDDHITGERIGK